MESYELSFHPDSLTRVHLALFHPLSPTLSASLLSRIITVSKLPTSTPDLHSRQREVDYAFLDASKLTSTQHVLTAVQQAIVAAARGEHVSFADGGIKTRTVHSEVIYRLGGNNNVSQALKDFGLTPRTTSLLLVRIGGQEEDEETVLGLMRGLLEQAGEEVGRGSDGEGPAVGTGMGKGEGEGATIPLAPLSLLGSDQIGFDAEGVRRIYKIEAGEARQSSVSDLRSSTGQGTDFGKGRQGVHEERRELDSIVCSLVALKGVA